MLCITLAFDSMIVLFVYTKLLFQIYATYGGAHNLVKEGLIKNLYKMFYFEYDEPRPKNVITNAHMIFLDFFNVIPSLSSWGTQNVNRYLVFSKV